MSDQEFETESAQFLKENGLQFAKLAEIEAKKQEWSAGSSEDKWLARKLQVIIEHYLPISGARYANEDIRDLVKISAEMSVIMRGEPYERFASYLRRVQHLEANEIEAEISKAYTQVAQNILNGKLPKDMDSSQLKDALVGVYAAPALRQSGADMLAGIIGEGQQRRGAGPGKG